MNRIFRLGLLLALVMTAVSCNDNKNDDKLFYSYVTVQAPTSGSELTLRRDAGAFLFVKSSLVNISGLREGDRLIVYYRIRGNAISGTQDYNVTLHRYYMVLTKDPILQSFLDANPGEDESLGNNATRVNDVWFGGRYLNINLSVYRNLNSSVSHLINLVADDVNFDGTTMTVYLRHNAYSDLPTIVGQTFFRSSLVSFDFVNLLDELELTTSPTFTLVWYEYDGTHWDQPLVQKQLVLGTFTPWTQDRALSSSIVNDLNDLVK